jgi:hypothetical protein
VDDTALWHVTLTLAGDPWPVDDVRTALDRLSSERPFLLSGRYDGERVELRYWDEGQECGDVCALALRLWGEHRDSAQLPPWRPVALKVVSRLEQQRREGSPVAAAAGWRPF